MLKKRTGKTFKFSSTYVGCAECKSIHEVLEDPSDKIAKYRYVPCYCPECGKETRHITLGRDIELTKSELQFTSDEDKTNIQLHATDLINRRKKTR